MPDTTDGKMVRLTIVPCNETKQGKIVALNEPKFTAMLNPTTLKRSQSINYDETEVQGKAAATPRFKSVGNDTISFSLLLDGTGVVDPSTSKISVSDRIDTLNGIIYKYVGDEHQPYLVRVLWGTFIFFGRLTTLSIDYTLFKPSGDPLRAKIDLSFLGAMSAKEESLEAKRSSPDLTHELLFRAGDSLPLLCHRIYGDSAYYTTVARYNNLLNFRDIPPGTTIFFPPLR